MQAALSLSDSVIVDEGAETTVTVSLDTAVAGGFMVDVSTGGGTATAGNDYDDTTQTLNFAGTENETQTFVVSVLTDTVSEPAESFEISLSNLQGTTVAVDISDTTTVSIRDTQSAALTVNFAFPDYSGDESVNLEVVVGLSAVPTRPITIVVDAVEGTATEADYSGLPATLVFDVGDIAEMFFITLTNDDIDEGNEQFGLRFANTDGVTLGSLRPTTQVRIQDSDFTLVTDLESVTVTEGTTATYNISLRNNPENAIVAVSPTSPDSNIVTVSPESFTFSRGNWNRLQPITVTAENDSDAVNETLTITHMGDANSREDSVTDAPVAVLVDDDEEAVLSIGDLMVEEGEIATVSVMLDSEVGGAFTVDVTTGGGTAAASDYTDVSQTLSFAGTAGEVQTFTVQTTEDTDVESDETFTVSFCRDGLISLATADINTAATGTITIEDDELTVSFENAPYSVNEGEEAVVTVSLSGTPDSDVTVRVNAGAASTAVSGVDYEAGDLPAEVIFVANAVRRCFERDLHDNDVGRR